MATVFTGAAALAGGFGPTALAANAQSTKILPLTIHNQECGANNNAISHWVHLYYPNGDHVNECFGGDGKTNANATIESFCPGNNFGQLFGSTDGYYASFTFEPGQGKHKTSHWTAIGDTFHVTAVSIVGHSGNATCP